MFSLIKKLTILTVVGIAFGLTLVQHARAQVAEDDIATILASLAQEESGSALQTRMCALLSDYPAGGEGLATLVRGLVLKSPKLASDFIDLASCANDEQKAGIGAGLGQATTIINEKDPEAATAIAQLVTASNDKIIQTAFIAAVGDGTAAIADGTGANTGGGATGATAGIPATPPPADSLSIQSSGGGFGGGTLSPSS